MSLSEALILAGGLGTRLRPAVADRPKVLAEIRGRPFLTYLLDQLAAAHVGHVVLCTGHLGEQVEATIGREYAGMHLVYSQEPQPLGTGGALRLALPLLTEDSAFVLNGDSYCQVHLNALAGRHHERCAAGTLTLTRVEDRARFGSVETDAGGRVTRFAEKGTGMRPGWINAGFYALERALIESIPEGRPVSLERDVFPVWIGRGLFGWEGGGRFLDIGTPESYAEAERFFASL